MLRILAPTDFSDNAKTAMRTALILARSYSAEIIFMHAFASPPVPATSPEEVYSTLYNEEQKEVQQKLQETCQQLYRELNLRPKEVLKQELILPTPLSDAILQLIASNKVDLVVMGSSGKNGLQRLILGSNTVEIMRLSPVSVLVIPQNFSFDGFKQITIVTKPEHTGYRSGLNLMLKFARTYSANLYFAVLLNHEEQTTELADLLDSQEQLMQVLDLPHQIIVIKKSNKTQALEEHIASTATDLLVWLPKQKSMWSDSLTESFTEEVAYKAGIPLLVIPDTHPA